MARYMHHFVRMTVASFLCKDLLLHWRLGQDWFWDTLCDADLAINAACESIVDVGWC